MSATSIELNNFSVERADQVIIKPINLTINRGKFISVIGHSGCGKSTLLQALANFIPHAGYKLLHGQIGYVAQDIGVFPFMTVIDHLKFVTGLSSSAPEITKLIDYAGLTKYRDSYPATLSGGQVQRLNFIRAFATKPEIALCDEPFSALDEQTRTQMQLWLLDYWQENKSTIIFVTHSTEEALLLSDQVIVLKSGEIAATLNIDLPRPRRTELLYSEEFIELRKELTQTLL